MKTTGIKRLHATVLLFTVVMILTCVFSSAEMAEAGETEYIDTLKAGVELVLDSELSLDEVTAPAGTDAAQTDSAAQTVTDAAQTDSAAQTDTEAAQQGAAQAETEAAGDGTAVSGQQEEQETACTFVMTNVQNTLNVRASAGEDAPIIGRLYADCYGDIMERGDEWTLIRSGNLVGWAKNEYLLFDEEAEHALAQVATWTATANESGLRIRKEASTDAGVYALLAQGDIVDIYEDLGDWLKVNYDGYEGYVAREYVTVDLLYATGETLAEISTREAAEAEARRRAEEEAAARRAALSEEQANVEANYSDVQLLAALIWCEAGNQPYEGQLAVGAVVMNRVNHPAYPNTISGVIYAPGQFTPAMTGRVGRALERGVPDSCTQAAIEAMSGVSNVGGALHFNTLAVRTSDLIIGAHAFW